MHWFLFQDEEPVTEEKEEEKIPEQPFQEVFVTCPDGLQVRYFLQSAVGKWLEWQLNKWKRTLIRIDTFASIFREDDQYHSFIILERGRYWNMQLLLLSIINSLSWLPLHLQVKL